MSEYLPQINGPSSMTFICFVLHSGFSFERVVLNNAAINRRRIVQGIRPLTMYYFSLDIRGRGGDLAKVATIKL